MSLFSNDLVVSLVDDAFIFDAKDRSEPQSVPAYVAVQKGTSCVLACGEEARAMRGCEPDAIEVIRVLKEGEICDRKSAEALFRFGVKQLVGRALIRPRVLISTRRGDGIRMELVKDMAMAGGARDIFLIEMGMATAIGMQLDVQKPEVQAVLSISDDWFEFSVISLAGVLSGVSGRIGSRTFVEDIRNHIMLCHQFRPEAEVLHEQLLNVGVSPEGLTPVSGWETWAGRTEPGRQGSYNLTPDDLALGMLPSLTRMTEQIKDAILKLSYEQQSMLSRSVIHATGSAMRAPGLARAVAGQLGYAVQPYASPVHPSVAGAKVVLKELKFLSRMKRS